MPPERASAPRSAPRAATPSLHVGGVPVEMQRPIQRVQLFHVVLMRRLGVRTVLSVDRHFAEQGFTVVPKL